MDYLCFYWLLLLKNLRKSYVGNLAPTPLGQYSDLCAGRPPHPLTNSIHTHSNMPVRTHTISQHLSQLPTDSLSTQRSSRGSSSRSSGGSSSFGRRGASTVASPPPSQQQHRAAPPAPHQAPVPQQQVPSTGGGGGFLRFVLTFFLLEPSLQR